MTIVAKESSNPHSSPGTFREIPSVTDAVEHVSSVAAPTFSPSALIGLTQRVLACARGEIASGMPLTREVILQRIIDDLTAMERPRLAPLLNATGIIIHTNLGRAPVSAETAGAMTSAASSYVPLELDPKSNARGGRMNELSNLIQLLTGAEATLVVNNNAAAVLLTLSAIAFDKEVIVSRGEAVEIGGGFRIPDVMRQSGAVLVEVGATNRTYARDYQNAITARTAAILKVHQSNFRIEGFTAFAPIEELVEVGNAANIPVINDLGSGALLDVSQFGLASEPTIQQSIDTGVSIVTASGDKLFGGPQAGIICGEARFVREIERHPLARAVRADKTCLAGMAATLRHYLRDDAVERIPVWRMIAASETELRRRAEAIFSGLPRISESVKIVPSKATTGGGSLPGEEMQSWALSIGAVNGKPVHEVALALRKGQPRVFGRIHEDRLLLDLRTILPEDDQQLGEAIKAATAGH